MRGTISRLRPRQTVARASREFHLGFEGRPAAETSAAGLQRSAPKTVTNRKRCPWRVPLCAHLPQQAHFSTEGAGKDSARHAVSSFEEQANKAIQSHFARHHAEALGAYRRGKDGVDEVELLVTNETDLRIPERPHDETLFASEERSLRLLLEEAKLVHRDDNDRLVLSNDSRVALKLHYTSKPCAGACKLYLTGDDSYVRFLKLLADDGMGLTLDCYGLWRRVDTAGRISTEQRLRQSTQARQVGEQSRADHASLQDASKPKSVMEEQRAEMGLPEGLDLSLDLGPSTGKVPSEHERHPREGAESLDSQQWERISAGTGSEADILDILGMAWIPPELRFVREPGAKG